MKNLCLLSVLVGLSLVGGCSGSGDPNVESRGGASAGGAPAGGATPTSGGTTPTSGGATPISGGTSSTSGGATSTSGGTTSTSGGATSTSGGSTTTNGGAPAAGTGGVAGGTTSAGGTGTGGAGTGGSTGTQHWVGTWATSPYEPTGDQLPTIPLSNVVARQVTRISIGGSRFRVQFSNKIGTAPVEIKSAHIALCKSTGAADSTIDTATDKALSFSGMASVSISAGQDVWSDPVDFTAAPLSKVTITTAFGNVPSPLTAHAGARTTSYFQANSTNVSAADMASATKMERWFYISGMDVMADAAAKAVAIIGDSITDGRGTDTDRNNRWTDILAERLQANEGTKNIGVLNQGIGATNLVGSGTAAEARFARDVLGQSGVKYAIIYDGVNDIAGDVTLATMKPVYEKLIKAGRDKGLLVFGATIAPFSGHSFYTAPHETVRQEVNTFIRSGAFDGVIDFDMALKDGSSPPKLQAAYAAWAQMDWLHPGPAGYKKMGDSVNLTLFK